MLQRGFEAVFEVVLILQVLNFLTNIDSKPQIGYFAGGTVGNSTSERYPFKFTNVTHPAVHHPEGLHIVPQNNVPATIIERGETLSNGCYKQIVRENSPNNFRQFITTEQLICPANVNMTAMAQLYKTPKNAPHYRVQPNVTGQFVTFPYAPVYRPPAVLPVPANDTPIAVLPPPGLSHSHLQKNQPDVFVPPQPVMIAVPDNATSQVLVLSQKTGYYDTKQKSNTGNPTLLLSNNNCSIILQLIVVTLFTYFM